MGVRRMVAGALTGVAAMGGGVVAASPAHAAQSFDVTVWSSDGGGSATGSVGFNSNGVTFNVGDTVIKDLCVDGKGDGHNVEFFMEYQRYDGSAHMIGTTYSTSEGCPSSVSVNPPSWTANYFVVAVRAVVCIEDWGSNTCKRGNWKDNPYT